MNIDSLHRLILDDLLKQFGIRKLKEAEKRHLNEAIIEGTGARLRPVLMTATVAMLGLIPFLFATGPGSEVQRPLAIVVIGGLITCTLLTLVVLPVMYALIENQMERKRERADAAALAAEHHAT